MRILIVANTIPYPAVSGGRLRLLNLIQRVANEHEVWLATHLQDGVSDEGAEYLRGYCRTVKTVQLRRQSPLSHIPGLLRFAAAGVPLELKFTYSEEMAAWLRETASDTSFDVVQIEESLMAPYLDALPRTCRARTVLSMYDVGYAQYARIASVSSGLMSKARAWLYSKTMSSWEPRTAMRFSRCVAVSDEDAALLREVMPGHDIDVVPNGVDTRLLRPLPRAGGEPTCMFVGNMSYAPCIDAVTFFCSEVLPIVRERRPETKMLIVGAHPAPEVRALAGDHVEVTGRVESVLPYYAQSHVAVVPLRAGGGTRLKILEAMALGRPVVSTTIGCEGLDVQSDEHLLVADDPLSMAEGVVRLLDQPALADGLVARARDRVETGYDWDIIAKSMLRVYSDLGASPTHQ